MPRPLSDEDTPAEKQFNDAMFGLFKGAMLMGIILVVSLAFGFIKISTIRLFNPNMTLSITNNTIQIQAPNSFNYSPIKCHLVGNVLNYGLIESCT